MPRQRNIPSTTYAPGSYEVVIDNIPPSSDGFEITLTRGGFPPGDVARIDIADSVDGVTFVPWISMTIPGGDIPNKNGVGFLAASRISGTWRGINDGNGGRRILRQFAVRATMTVFQPFTTAISMTDK
jgi:hypothetical protein